MGAANCGNCCSKSPAPVNEVLLSPKRPQPASAGEELQESTSEASLVKGAFDAPPRKELNADSDKRMANAKVSAELNASPDKTDQARMKTAPKSTKKPESIPQPHRAPVHKEAKSVAGVRVQVMLDGGEWGDIQGDELKQISDNLSGGETRFTIQARGAMYIIDLTDRRNGSQTNAVSKKSRRLRVFE